MACTPPRVVYEYRERTDPSKLSFNGTNPFFNNSTKPSFPFHFFPFHDATTAGDASQINNVKQGVGPIVVTILIIVAVSVIVTSLAAFFIFNARRRRRVSDRMAKEERGVTSLDKFVDPAARFRPRYTRRRSNGLFSRILRGLRLSKKTPPTISRMPEKMSIDRWDAHARSISDSIECTKNERSGSFDTCQSPVRLSLPFSGLSSAQNRVSSAAFSSETHLRHQASTGNLSEKYTRVPNRPRRPSNALFSVALPSTAEYWESFRDRHREPPSRVPVGAGAVKPDWGSPRERAADFISPSSSGIGMLSMPIPAPTLDFPRFRLGPGPPTSTSFSTNGATIPEFVEPDDDGSSRKLGTERSFTIQSLGKPF